MKQLTIILFAFVSLSVLGQNTTELTGIVKNIQSDTLVLAKSHEDLRYNGIEIPVSDNVPFRFTLSHEYTEEYVFAYKSELTKGVWKPILFFLNGGTLEFELYPGDEFAKNKIIGDDLSESKKQYRRQFEKQFMAVGNGIYEKLFQSAKGSDAHRQIKLKLDSLNREVLAFQYDYFLDDPGIVGLQEYVFLLENAEQMMIAPELFGKYQEYYLRKHPSHPLTERAYNLFTALSNIKVGQNYVDIDFTDRNNDTAQLSDFIAKKSFTIVDLWSPWCGPCIAKSKKLKANYGQLSSNTQIIGIVGGVDQKATAEKAIDRYAYPWKNYLEISNQHKIWEKYGIEKSGGAQFLMDKQGKILAINPTQEQLMEIVSGR